MPTVSFKTLAQAAFLIAYLLCCHYAVTLNAPRLQLLAVLLLAVGIILRGLLDKSVLSYSVIIVLMAGALAMEELGLLRFVLYLPPVILPLLLWSVFFRSLLPGQTPLVTGIAREVRGSLSDELCDYTRNVTALWSAAFLLLATLSALLPFVATAHTWSLFTNCLNYMLIAALFIVEFLYRQRRFSNLEHKTFWQYLQSILRVDVRQFR